ncbi:MAG: DUF4350 domain-containing protein [Acidimicrobiales bacterium]
MLSTFRKELTVIWTSPVPWVMGALFHALWGALYVSELEARRQALFQPAVPLAAFLLLVVVPVLTMRTVAEEAKNGTLEVLLAVPVRVSGLTVGKWLATWSSVVAVLAPMAATVVVIERAANLDPGPVLTGAVGLVVFAGALTGVGVLVSALTSSQSLAAAGAFLLGLMVWFAAAAPGATGLGGVLARVSFSERLRTFAAGGIDIADLVYFVSVTLGAVVLAAVAVARRRAHPRSDVVGSLAGAARLAALAAVVGLTVGAVLVADDNRRLFDLTTGDALTLSEASVAVVESIEEPISITAFVGRDDPARVPVSSLLDRYRKTSDLVSFAVRDPDAAPAEMRRLGVDPVFGGLAVRRAGRVEVASGPTEQDVTAAIARVLRDEVPVVCLTTGHGEPSRTDTGGAGLSGLSVALEAGGHVVDDADLLVGSGVPERCDVLLVAGPTAPLSEQAAEAVRDWLAAGGRALVLTDPAASFDWDPILGAYGISVDRGIVFELDADHRFPNDPTRPIVLDYRTTNPIGRRLAPTFYPGAQALITTPDAENGLAVTAVAATTSEAYLERQPLTPVFDQGEDLQGPITLVAAADRSASVDGAVTRTRLVVTADADFASNDFVSEAGNQSLLIRAVDWLTVDDDLVSVAVNLAPVRPLDLTASRLRFLRLLSVGLIPAILLALGSLGWALRRVR